jgi:MATE family multidrug resistance protein
MNTKFSDWRQQAQQLVKLGAPILVGQLAQTGMGTTDTIMAGRYGAADLAAIAIGQSFWLPTLIFFIGLLSATTTLVAYSNGAGKLYKVRGLVQQSMWIALALLPLGIAILLHSNRAALLMGIEQDVAAIMQRYMGFLAAGLPAAVACMALRGAIEGTGHTRTMMMISVLGFLINIPLNYVLIFGKLGLPEFGGAGCGIATSTVLWLQCLAAFVVCQQHSYLKPLALFKRLIPPAWQQIKPIIVLGLPIALTMLAEVSLFSVVALLIADLGTEILAGHQVALSVSGLTFMLPLSTGIAIMIQVGHYMGANNISQARFASLVGISIALAIAVTNTAVILLARDFIAGVYTTDAAVQAIAAGLLVYTAIYQLPDAIQIAVTHALRGYRDTRVPLYIVLVAYWLISVPIGWVLSRGLTGHAPMGAAGMWLGLVIGLSVAAVFQSWRFKVVLARTAS